MPSGDAVNFVFSRFHVQRPVAAGGLLLPAGEAASVEMGDVGGGAGGVEAAAVEATLGRQRRLSEDCFKNLTREECTNPSSATMLVAAMGKTLYAHYAEYCYQVAIGGKIDSKWTGGGSKNNPTYCENEVTYSGDAYYVNGRYSAFHSPADGSSQAYTGGSNTGCGIARSATLTLNVLENSIGDLQITVDEPSLCVYSITLTGSVEDFGLASCD